MKRVTTTLLLATLVATAGATGCGTDTSATSGTDATSAAVASAARQLESRDGDDRDEEDGPDDRDGDGDDDDRDQEVRVSRFKTLMDDLRAVPALEPLFAQYGVPNPIVYDASARGLVELLRAVRIRVSFGSLSITNRETGGVIYAAPLIDLASGTLQPEHLPGATTPPPAPSTCTYFTYSPWGACQADGTQTRTVLVSSPAGCTGGAPVTSQACTSAPPPPPVTCTGFTYSAWGACQPSGTQTRTVVASTPAGCTGGAPVTSRSCTYTAPACAYTYSGWSTCSAAGTQTRTVVSSTPAGCAGTPVLSQTCTPPTQACNTCHGVPPSSGTHGSPHSFSCGTCHGTGYSATAVNAATHRDGSVNLAATPGWNATTRSCANSCHGSRSW